MYFGFLSGEQKIYCLSCAYERVRGICFRLLLPSQHHFFSYQAKSAWFGWPGATGGGRPIYGNEAKEESKEKSV